MPSITCESIYPTTEIEPLTAFLFSLDQALIDLQISNSKYRLAHKANEKRN